ncbi:MAG TPA: type II toxin-antitoxin system HicA family toxin [Pyrinomonadaceae bacterium]|jgi:predicted RNA binding protein YcfA (HicA-like mRNA interferase family)|nr:type II toxin-antitoxin system HicA family toxin [Pyrinomonadaceae bacterium]
MRKRKLLDRLKNNPQGATFRDVRTLLIQHGFQLERVTGSHHIFSRADATFAIPVQANRVKSAYVRQVIKLLEQSKGNPE